jgi:hypothetical protein
MLNSNNFNLINTKKYILNFVVYLMIIKDLLEDQNVENSKNLFSEITFIDI